MGGYPRVGYSSGDPIAIWAVWSDHCPDGTLTRYLGNYTDAVVAEFLNSRTRLVVIRY